MPHKAPRCPSCNGRSRQIRFIKASPDLSDRYVDRGTARFKCKSCGRHFISWGGIRRKGATRTYWKYKKERFRKTFKAQARECFEAMRDPKFGWVTMKDLFRCLKRGMKVSIKEFKEEMKALYDSNEIWTSRGSIARPHVARYGLKEKNGVHYYVKFPREAE